jgi:hypothetical protein
MLHVDAKGDTYIDAVNTLHIADDVVVTPEGRIGVGTTTPQTRLDIRGSLRIADGTEGAGRILVSDAGGAARWKPGNWYAAIRGGSTTSSLTPFTFTSSDGLPGADLASGSVTVPHTGLYTCTVTGLCDPASPVSASDSYIYVMVYVNEIGRAGFGKVMPRTMQEYVYFSDMYILHLNENDVVYTLPYPTSATYTYVANVYSDVTLRLDFVR